MKRTAYWKIEIQPAVRAIITNSQIAIMLRTKAPYILLSIFLLILANEVADEKGNQPDTTNASSEEEHQPTRIAQFASV